MDWNVLFYQKLDLSGARGVVKKKRKARTKASSKSAKASSGKSRKKRRTKRKGKSKKARGTYKSRHQDIAVMESVRQVYKYFIGVKTSPWPGLSVGLSAGLSVGLSAGWLFWYNFLKGREVSLSCFYQSPCKTTKLQYTNCEFFEWFLLISVK